MFKNTIFHAFTKISESDHFFTPLCTRMRVPTVHWLVVACKDRLRAKWNLDFPSAAAIFDRKRSNLSSGDSVLWKKLKYYMS